MVPTQSTLPDGDHLPSVLSGHLLQAPHVLGLSQLFELRAAGRVTAHGAVEFICEEEAGR